MPVATPPSDHITLQLTEEGQEIIIHPNKKEKKVVIYTRIFWILLGFLLLIWSVTAIQNYYLQQKIVPPLTFLNQFHLSTSATFWIVNIWCFILMLLMLGSINDIFLMFRKQDRFVLKADSWLIEQRRFWKKREEFHLHEGYQLYVDSYGGSLQVRGPQKKIRLTNLGQETDRIWLKATLAEKYSLTDWSPFAQSTPYHEIVAGFNVQYNSDGSLKISDSRIARFSRLGCVVLLGMSIVILVIKFNWQFFNLWPLWSALSLFIVSLPFLLLIYSFFYNRREITASHNFLKINVWRFDVFTLPSLWFSQKEYVIRNGTLLTQEEITIGIRSKRAYINQILRVQQKNEPTLENLQDLEKEGYILIKLPQFSRTPLLYLAKNISHVTGFPLREES